MIIAGMIKSSLVDFPGQVSCVLFVPGCNLDCFYCHNRSLIDGTHPLLLTRDVWDFLKKRVGLLDGVVITGGEPTLQPDLIPFIREIRDMGYKIKLDTNGMAPSIADELLTLGLCDYYAVDYKAPAARYSEICGRRADAHTVLKTINLIAESGVKYEVRTTVAPTLAYDDLIIMAKELPTLNKYVLNRYRKPKIFLPCDLKRIDYPALSPDEIRAAVESIRPFQPNVVY